MKQHQKILLLGSGALKIGEAGEFDYSGTQAIKALKEEGKTVLLINPNIATIQTSEGLADEVYFLPVTPEFVEKVIAKERPDGIMLSFGGQTALNCGIALYKAKILEKYQVEVLGTPIQTIIDTEDRELFAGRLAAKNLLTAKGRVVTSLSDAISYASELGFPVMLRTGFALGGAGSGVARDESTLTSLVQNAFATGAQVIVEECLWGWKEVEYEVVRDRVDNCITVCNMENFDPVGIHTGESIVIAPSQTLNDTEYYGLRDIAIRTIRELGIVGECNIQYALNPKNGDYRIIEVNARLSRSSALASKATGYPLAYVAAKLALGKILPELRNAITGNTSAFFEPALDYVVVKIPRWDLDKYELVDPTIGSEMKSVGEVMSIARTFKEALQKAVRSLNLGFDGIIDDALVDCTLEMLKERLRKPDPKRVFVISAAFTKGMSVEEIAMITGIDPWFLYSLRRIVQTYVGMTQATELTSELLSDAKRQGFADTQIARKLHIEEKDVRKKRIKEGILPVIKRIDTMAGEFPAKTNYLYMTYGARVSDYVPDLSEDKIVVLGGGPYAIGTSVEFDWCAVNTVETARKHGKKTVMINCNPETVSTDFDTTDYLYFEELSFERVSDILDREQSPVIVSVGGQIPNNLAPKLAASKRQILGTQASSILKAEDRQEFSKLLDTLNVSQPAWREVHGVEESLSLAGELGFPVLIRPSFVLSGKAMLVVETETQLREYLDHYKTLTSEYSMVMTKFMLGATECDFDGVAQNGSILVHALSEHVEHGGVHSGDATLVLPSFSLSDDMKGRIQESSKKIVKSLKVNGPFNIQFLVSNNELFVIECNLRASRSVPFVSKATNVNFIRLATNVAMGIDESVIVMPQTDHVTVKAPQFSFRKLRGADPILRVEMSSTGEVAAFGKDRFEAYLKAICATGVQYPVQKTVFLSLGGENGKKQFLQSSKTLSDLGFTIYATSGTHEYLAKNGVVSERVGKLYAGEHPNYMDLLKDHKISFAVVLQERFTDAAVTQVENGMSDGYTMRRLSIDLSIPIFTNGETAALYIESMNHYAFDTLQILPWSSYI